MLSPCSRAPMLFASFEVKPWTTTLSAVTSIPARSCPRRRVGDGRPRGAAVVDGQPADESPVRQTTAPGPAEGGGVHVGRRRALDVAERADARVGRGFLAGTRAGGDGRRRRRAPDRHLHVQRSLVAVGNRDARGEPADRVGGGVDGRRALRGGAGHGRLGHRREAEGRRPPRTSRPAACRSPAAPGPDRSPTGGRPDREEQEAEAEHRAAWPTPAAGSPYGSRGRLLGVAVHAGHDNEPTLSSTAPV